MGRKDDGLDGRGDMKPRWDLLPFVALSQVVDVLTFGAKKYAPESWREVKKAKSRYGRATIGHVVAWMRGERYDKESGLHHLAHAACNLLFLLEHSETKDL